MLHRLKHHGGLLALIPLAAALLATGIWVYFAPPMPSGGPVQVEGQVVSKTTLHRPYSTETNGTRQHHMHETYLLTLALPSGNRDAPHTVEQQVNIAAFHGLATDEPVNITLDPTSLRILDIRPGPAPDPGASGRLMALGLVLLGLLACFVIWLRITRAPDPA